MKHNLFLVFLLSMIAVASKAQVFVTKGTVEYEVKTNIKKSMGNSSWADMMSENLPQYKTGYYKLTFADNKSIYKFDRWDPNLKMPDFLKKSDEENVWYFDHDGGKFSMQKNIFGSNFNVQDSIINIQWKLSNENRIIAGYNCRKAVGKIMDSVYIFAFYTDEIMVSGGPCTISGLPGMILGLTIPRLYSSFIATKVTLDNVNAADIKPVTAKTIYTMKNFQSNIKERTKDWGNSDDPDSQRWIEQFMWATML